MQQPLLSPMILDDEEQAASAPGTSFYRNVMRALNDAGLPFLVGGAYAFVHYTGISRPTKDLDLFIRRSDYPQISAALTAAGYRTEMVFPHWLAKAVCKEQFADLIFSSGNGIAEVDDAWFAHAPSGTVLDVPAKICPVEESIWSKASIMERERFDGADIAHLLLACGATLDWPRLMQRFDAHWRILLSHVSLFGFIYPGHRDRIPAWVVDELAERLRRETHAPPTDDGICFGTLLSREQYLVDVEQWGYQDARLAPVGNMSRRDTSTWTDAIPQERRPHE